MPEFKEYITSILILSVILQLGGVIVQKTQYSSIYKIISGFIIMTYIVSPLLQNIRTSPNFDYNFTQHTFEEQSITNIFETHVSEKIKSDIYAQFNVDCIVKTVTDMTKLQIYISGNFDSKLKKTIKNYVLEKYCNQNDEVIVNNVD